jgi:ADP-ribosylglycohydrolase
MPSILERYKGSLLGLAVGDALGAPFEGLPPGSFSLNGMMDSKALGLMAGQWSDDTAMALCLAESLIESRGHDPFDQMRKYLQWYEDGYMSCTGFCYGIGNTTLKAIQRFRSSGNPESGLTSPRSAGNGSLMRLAPVALFYAGDPLAAHEKAALSSITTHRTTECIDACRYMAGLIVGALSGLDKDELLSPRFSPVRGYFHVYPLCNDIEAVADGGYKDKLPDDITASGYVVESIEAALWSFYHSQDFREACLLAAHLGYDTDTTAAICGQLAGAYYGVDAIPKEWLDKLSWQERIEEMAELLYTAMDSGENPI